MATITQWADDGQSYENQLSFVRQAMAVPVLSREEELALATLWRQKGDAAALQKLISAYTRLAVALASKFKGYGLPVADLVQEGTIGLLQAANRFEPQRDIRFSTYASWWVRASIQDYILRNWSIVRTGTTSAHKSLFFNLRRLRAKLASAENGGQLTHAGRAEIAHTLGVDVQDVEIMEQRLTAPDKSLNLTLADDSDDKAQDFLPDPGPTPEEHALRFIDGAKRSRWLQQALKALPAREQQIIRRRHLAEAEDIITLEDMGSELGISKERVRQLETRALQQIFAHVRRAAQASGQVAIVQDAPLTIAAE